jgi:hypothetical protein
MLVRSEWDGDRTLGLRGNRENRSALCDLYTQQANALLFNKDSDVGDAHLRLQRRR